MPPLKVSSPSISTHGTDTHFAVQCMGIPEITESISFRSGDLIPRPHGINLPISKYKSFLSFSRDFLLQCHRMTSTRFSTLFVTLKGGHKYVSLRTYPYEGGYTVAQTTQKYINIRLPRFNYGPSVGPWFN